MQLCLTPEYQYDSPLRYNEAWQRPCPREPGHLQHDLLDHCHHTTAGAGLLLTLTVMGVSAGGSKF